MPSSSYELRVDSEAPFAFVEIADSHYRIIAKGVGNVTKHVPPGLYVVRAKYSDRVREQIVRVVRQGLAVRLDRLPSTPGKVIEEETNALLVKKVQEFRDRAPYRNRVTVAIRNAHQTPEPKDAQTAAPQPIDFEVWEMHGQSMQRFGSTNFERQLSSSLSADAALAFAVEVASLDVPVGWYSFGMSDPDKLTGMETYLPLYVPPRFSPTVFVETRMTGGRRSLAFDRLLVSYDAQVGNSDGDPMRLKALQVAHRALELGRTNAHLSDALLGALQVYAHRDPALGLLALQLLLLPERSGAFRKTMFLKLMTCVSEAFGMEEHPDLVIARARARRLGCDLPQMSGDEKPLIAPPLLRANWNHMVTMPDRKREVTTKGSLLHYVGQSLVRAGIWLLWTPPSVLFFKLPPHPHSSEISSYDGPALMHERSSKRHKPTQLSADDVQILSTLEILSPVRSSRAADSILETIVDLVQQHPDLQTDIRSSLISGPPVGTTLDRTIARAVLQLAEITTSSGRKVPKGYSRRLAKSLALPLSLLTDSMTQMRRDFANRVS